MFAHISNRYLSDTMRRMLLALLAIVCAALFAAMPAQAQVDRNCNEEGGHAKYSISVEDIGSDRITLVSTNLNDDIINRAGIYVDAPGPIAFDLCGELDLFSGSSSTVATGFSPNTEYRIKVHLSKRNDLICDISNIVTFTTIAGSQATATATAGSQATPSPNSVALSCRNIRATPTPSPTSAPAATPTPTSIPPAPVAPSGLATSGITQTSIALTWTKSPGATGYDVRAGTSGSWTRLGDVATYTFTGLSADTSYTMQVRAFNSGGSSAAASIANTTLPNAPAPPSGLTVTRATQTQLTLSWTKSAGATAYSIQVDSGTATAIGNVSSTIVTSLSAGTEYALNVFASNAGGSSAAASVTASTLPAVPTGLSTSSITQTAITLNWTKSSGASGYDVRGGTHTAWTNAGDVATYAFSGLTANTQYSLEVRAKNSAGSTAAASVASRTLAAQGLASPSGVATSGITTTSITLNWTKVSAATTYEVNGGALTGWTDAGDVATYTFSGLSADSFYNLQVRAKNATLTSPAVTIPESTLPTSVSPPSNVRTTNITDSEIVLLWSDPIESQSFTIQSAYTYQILGGMIKTWTDVGDVLKFMFEGLDPVTEYNLRVRRVNRGVLSPTVATSAWTLALGNPNTSARPSGGTSGASGSSGSGSDSAAIDATPSGPAFRCSEEQKALFTVSPQPNNLNIQCVDARGVGNAAVIERGVVLGVDVWGWVPYDFEVCFRRAGDLVFLDAAFAPRVQTRVLIYIRSGMTCALLNRTGTVVLVNTSWDQYPVLTQEPPSAPAATPFPTTFEDCMVTTNAALNFRQTPSGKVQFVVPAKVTLTVYKIQENWVLADFYGYKGWLHSDFLILRGDCS